VRGDTRGPKKGKEVKKTLIAAAAAIAIAPVSLVIAPEAHAWPLCDQAPTAIARQMCEQNCSRPGVNPAPCNGGIPGLPDDCKKYTLPSDQARCGDRHIAGQQ
jgi:hypothetical protein